MGVAFGSSQNWFYNNPKLIQNGLVLHLDAANLASYSGSGSTWYDLSGNGNDVTTVSSPTYNSGYWSTGTYGYFTGSGTSSIPTGNSPYTMQAWIRLPAWGYRSGIMAIGSYGTLNQSNALRTGDNQIPGDFVHYWWANDLNITNNDASLSTNVWFMITALYDGTNRTVWANTTQIGTDTPGTHNVTSTSFEIASTYFGGETLKGDIAIALIYNKALISAEIQSNFNFFKTRFGL